MSTPWYRARKPTEGRLIALGRSSLLIIITLAIWWVLTATVMQNPRIYPTPPDVFDALLRIASNEGPIGSPYGHMWATLSRILTAFALAYFIGTFFGVIGGRVRWFFDFSTTLVWIAFAVPSVVWVFIFLIVFGISDVVPVLALVVLLSAPVFIGTAEGVKGISEDLVVMADSFRVTRLRQFAELFLPSILPYMLANARVAFALCIKIVIIAEVIGLPNGIGLLVRYWSDRLYMAPVVAWGLILVILGLVVDSVVFGYCERRAKTWTTDQTNAAQ